MLDIPPHNYFMMSDGTYCHLLPDKIVIGQRNEIEYMPEMNQENRKAMFLTIIFVLLVVGAAVTFLYFIGQMLPEMLALIWMVVIAASYRLYHMRDSSSSEMILKSSIRSTKLVRHFMGYSAWVIFFTTDKGERLRRFVKIYDSKDHEARAERVLREEGFL